MLGGLFLDDYNASESIISIPYIQDDFTWCVQGAKLRPWILSPMTAMTPAVWLLLIFGYGYVVSFILFILIQFDKKYSKRNDVDWHYTLFLIILPSVIGMGQTFRPIAWKIRIFYGLTLLLLVLYSQTMVGYLLKFTQIRFSMHQVATVQEITAAKYQLMGSKLVGSLIKFDDKVGFLLQQMAYFHDKLLGSLHFHLTLYFFQKFSTPNRSVNRSSFVRISIVA